MAWAMPDQGKYPPLVGRLPVISRMAFHCVVMVMPDQRKKRETAVQPHFASLFQLAVGSLVFFVRRALFVIRRLVGVRPGGRRHAWRMIA